MFTLNDILQGNAGKIELHCTVQPDPELTFREAQHDSRQVATGDLYIAIKGERVDGHNYIPAAARAGALAALCTQLSTEVPADFLQIVVPDVVAALQATARIRAQKQQDTIFIGITGSNGKTSTKDAVAAVLSHRAPTLKTLKSYNNEIGYPLTLLRLEPQHRYAVLEMGAQWVGELAGLCRTIATPNWSIITNVGTSHLEYFGSQENIAQAKGELVEALTEDGIAILNYDDPRVRAMNTRTRARVLSYGLTEEAKIRGSDVQNGPLLQRSFLLHYQDQQQRINLNLQGDHGITIALAAAAVGAAAGMTLEEVSRALESLATSPGRGEIKAGPHGSTIIDDTYNASRLSITAIVQAMHKVTETERGARWALLGDIFELGTFAREEHYTTGAAIAQQIDYLVAIGDQARFYVEGAIAAGMPEKNVYYFSADVTDSAILEAAKRAAADLLVQQVQPGDLVLLKGSRGMRMESMLDMFSA